MLVEDDVWNHHVADVAVQRRSLAHHVDTRDPRAVLGDLAEYVVRGQTQRVVDVDDARVGLTQPLRVDRSDAFVDELRIQARDLEDLRRAVDARAARRDMADSAGRLELHASLPKALAAGMQVVELPGTEVQPDLSRGAAVPPLHLVLLLLTILLLDAD